MADMLASLQAKRQALEDAEAQLKESNKIVRASIGFFLDWLDDIDRADDAENIRNQDKDRQCDHATTTFRGLDTGGKKEARAWILKQLGEELAEAKKDVERQHQVVTGYQPPEALAEDLVNSLPTDLQVTQPPVDYEYPTRVGRLGFDRAIIERVDEPPLTVQLSRALVLMSGSGVGKTYAPLTARSGQQQLKKRDDTTGVCNFELITAYIGFNCNVGLTGIEREYLIDDWGKKRDHLIPVMVGRRLYVTLCALLNTVNSEEVSGASPFAPLEGKESPVQRCVTQIDALPKLTEAWVEDSVADLLKKRIIGKLVDLGEKTSAPLLVVLVALDEAQMLDAFTYEKGQKTPWGARLALRYLRQLQVEAFKGTNHKVMLLPLATGINPVSNISTDTEGRNIVLHHNDEVLVNRKDFKAFSEVVFKDAQLEPKEAWNAYQAAIWPRVRELVRTKRNPVISQRGPSLIAGYDCESIIFAAASGKYLKNGAIPLNLARKHEDDEGDKATPIIDYSFCKSLMDELAEKRGEPVSNYQLPWLELSPSSIYMANDTTGRHFEESAFATLRLFIAVFLHPTATNSRLKVERATIMEWVPMTGLRLQFAGSLSQVPRCMHPFGAEAKAKNSIHAAGTLENSICHGLSEDFSEKVKSLKEVGDAMIAHCGGKSPFDYILVVCTKVEPPTLAVRYADAKAGLSKSVGKLFTSVSNPFKRVHAALGELLPSIGYELEKPKKGGARAMVRVITLRRGAHSAVINTNSFSWSPFTDILFNLPESAEEEGGPGDSLGDNRRPVLQKVSAKLATTSNLSKTRKKQLSTRALNWDPLRPLPVWPSMTQPKVRNNVTGGVLMRFLRRF
eukprot:TRINITY_DN329_c0_g1_i3.p1 TRINITY_DN329_c0_g1~~TRINITY_DN329_c0_g1_i3.p1  ORF type:complete len:860 (+),score=109.25 TRINITY_DN329_c0_g1_i3:37-2580(+)